MQRKKSEAIIIGLLALLLAVGLGTTKAAWADSSIGKTATAHLDFKVVISDILYLQVGSQSAVDTITFDISNIPGSGKVEGSSNADYPVPVIAAGFVGAGRTMLLEADSTTPLSDGTNKIPFSEIKFKALGDLTTSEHFNDGKQKLESWTDSGFHKGKYRFFYDNDEYYPASTYTGTVIYTLSSP